MLDDDIDTEAVAAGHAKVIVCVDCGNQRQANRGNYERITRCKSCQRQHRTRYLVKATRIRREVKRKSK